MTEPILSTDYWRHRLAQAQTAGELHHAVFRCPLDRWQRIEAKHREILARHVKPTDHVLDAGCGYGRLLDLMPEDRQRADEDDVGYYVGVDLSPDLIREAKQRYEKISEWLLPGEEGLNKIRFHVGDLRDLSPLFPTNWRPRDGFDLAILISIRPMVRRNCGEDVWAQMERELRRVARRLLFLEYDETDEGEVS